MKNGVSVFFLFTVLSGTAVLQPQSRSTAPRRAAPRATLADAFQSVTNMTPAQFSAAGLNKLTDDELSNLSQFISQKENSAAEAARSGETHYKCGPFSGNYDKVKIFMEASSGTPDQISSGIRQRLRAMKDVEIVYSATDADFGISLLGLENKSGAQVFGYSVALATFDACEAS